MEAPGQNASEPNAAEDGDREGGIAMLHRMITYVREEALRLKVMDVAVLLEHAEDAVTAFAPAALNGLGPEILDTRVVEH